MIPLTTAQKNELKELYKELYNIRQEIENKFKGNEYSIFTCEIGEKYIDSDIKLMLIGRCANGWPYDKPKTSDIFGEKYVEKFSTAKDFDWILENKDGTQYSETHKARNGENYNLEYSHFWTYDRAFFKKLTEDIKEQYKDARIWQDYIVQSDLYKISPKLSGNPTKEAVRMQKDVCLELLNKEIEILKPTHILFATDEGWWLFDEIKEKLSKPSAKYAHIKLTGHYLNVKAIVAQHPGNYRAGIKEVEYVKECFAAFKELEKQR